MSRWDLPVCVSERVRQRLLSGIAVKLFLLRDSVVVCLRAEALTEDLNCLHFIFPFYRTSCVIRQAPRSTERHNLTN